MRNRRVLQSAINGFIACLLLLVTPWQEARALRSQSKGEREFVGTINHTLKVRMRLSRNGEALSGSYAYEKIGKSLRLNGKLYDEKQFSIDEFDARGQRTGTFTGNFATPDWIEGYWSDAPAGKKQLPFSAQVLDGKQIPAANTDDQLSGQYRRAFRGSFETDPATLNVWLLKDGRYRVAGDALWMGPGDSEHRSVHVGNVDGVFTVQERKIFYKDPDMEDGCSLTIAFGRGSLKVTDDNSMCGGVNVSFDGEYKKVGPPHS